MVNDIADKFDEDLMNPIYQNIIRNIYIPAIRIITMILLIRTMIIIMMMNTMIITLMMMRITVMFMMRIIICNSFAFYVI